MRKRNVVLALLLATAAAAFAFDRVVVAELSYSEG